MVDPVAKTQAELEQEPPYDTSDKDQVNTKRKKAARTRAERLEFVKASMSFEQGRAWFYEQLTRLHVFQTPYLSGDPHGTSFRCGELNAGLMILSDIQDAAPQDYMKMISENK